MTDQITNQQSAILNCKFQVSPSGVFEIIAINAGQGNGLLFKPDVLRESIPLWENVQCFIDHDGTRARSVTQLAGVCKSPAWDDIEQGIRLTLTTAGPAGEIVNELGRAILSGTVPDLNAGFSADVFLQFEPDGKTVKKVIKVYSLDVVYNPARGGKFLRVLNQAEGAAPTGRTLPANSPTPHGGSVVDNLNPQTAAGQSTDSNHQSTINNQQSAIRNL